LVSRTTFIEQCRAVSPRVKSVGAGQIFSVQGGLQVGTYPPGQSDHDERSHRSDQIRKQHHGHEPKAQRDFETALPCNSAMDIQPMQAPGMVYQLWIAEHGEKWRDGGDPDNGREGHDDRECLRPDHPAPLRWREDAPEVGQ
jgi:hypothetical protein